MFSIRSRVSRNLLCNQCDSVDDFYVVCSVLLRHAHVVSDEISCQSETHTDSSSVSWRWIVVDAPTRGLVQYSYSRLLKFKRTWL